MRWIPAEKILPAGPGAVATSLIRNYFFEMEIQEQSTTNPANC
jgi:hypothetical protein